MAITNSMWIQSSSTTLPRAEYNQAIGFYNKTIFLLGGVMEFSQLIQYNIDTNIFIDHGTNVITQKQNYAQYYTQINHILYMKAFDEHSISIFDLKTQQFTQSFTTNAPIELWRSCLASTNEYLFVVGGSDALWDIKQAFNIVLTYNLLNKEWINNIPSMNEQRSSQSCIIHPINNMLYVFGGLQPSKALSSIETINTTLITQHSWSYIDPLSQDLAWTRAVIYKNKIFIIGGADENWQTVDIVHEVNVLTNVVSVSLDRMSLDLSEVAAVVVEGVVYLFGGWNDNSFAVNTWMKYEFITSPSTLEPIVTSSETTPGIISTLQSVHSTDTFDLTTSTSAISTLYAESSLTTAVSSTEMIVTTQSTQSMQSVNDVMHTVSSEISPDLTNLVTNSYVNTNVPFPSGPYVLVFVLLLLIGMICCSIVVAVIRSGSRFFSKRKRYNGNEKNIQQKALPSVQIIQSNIVEKDGTKQQHKDTVNYEMNITIETMKNAKIVLGLVSTVGCNVHDDTINDEKLLMGSLCFKGDVEDGMKGDTVRYNERTVEGEQENGGYVEENRALCAQCGLIAQGNVDHNDEQFYCFVCWSQYEATDGEYNTTTKEIT